MARFIEQLTSFAPIPSGTLARVTAKIMPGGYTMPGGAEIDVGLFTKITQGWKPPPPAKPVWMMATHATADSEPNVIGAYTLELYFTCAR